MSRYITLGDGRKITLGKYVAGWKQCLKLDPRAYVGRCPDGWDGRAADALEQLRAGMHDRINRHDPRFGRGRKWSHDWQRQTIQAAVRLNTPRLIIDWLPADLKARFAHRLRNAA